MHVLGTLAYPLQEPRDPYIHWHRLQLTIQIMNRYSEGSVRYLLLHHAVDPLFVTTISEPVIDPIAEMRLIAMQI